MRILLNVLLCSAVLVSATARSTALNATRTHFGADPSSGWLSYAIYNAPKTTDTITKLSATMVVPDKLSSHGFGSEPAFWFGVQTSKGDGALVQPIMAKWLGGAWYMFHEVFDWTDERDVQGKQVQVAPGDVVEASVAFTPAADFATSGLGSYAMSMTSRDTKEQLTYTYDLLPGQKSSEATAYFVLEHQPFTCRGSLPGNGNVTWTDIKVEVNGAPVATPQWEAEQEQPKCGSKATVLSTESVEISWDV